MEEISLWEIEPLKLLSLKCKGKKQHSLHSTFTDGASQGVKVSRMSSTLTPQLSDLVFYLWGHSTVKLPLMIATDLLKESSPSWHNKQCLQRLFYGCLRLQLLRDTTCGKSRSHTHLRNTIPPF